MNARTLLTTDGGLTDLVIDQPRDATGTPKEPDTITLTVDGTVVSGSPVFDAVSGEISYSWSSGEITILTGGVLPRFNVKAVWVFDIGGEQEARTQYFDVLEHDFRSDVNSADLERLVPDLVALRGVVSGRATAGTISSLTDAERLKRGDLGPQYYAGSKLQTRDGPRRMTERLITQYDPVAGTLTVEPDFEYAPDPGDPYEIHLGWNAVIRDSWERLYLRLQDHFGRDQTGELLDGQDVTNAHKYLAIASALSGYSSVVGGARTARYANIAAEFKSMFDATLQQTLIKIDGGVDGVTDNRLYRDFGRYLD